MSISPTFYKRKCFLYLPLCNFWQKNVSAKAGCKVLGKMPLGVNNVKHKLCFLKYLDGGSHQFVS
jgi:hypothetical protein